MHTGDEGVAILDVKVIPDFGPCCGNVFVGGGSQYGQGFVSIEGMDLKPVDIHMHELRKITKVRHQLVSNLVISLNEGGNDQMRAITNSLNGVIIDTRVFVIVFVARINCVCLSLTEWGHS